MNLKGKAVVVTGGGRGIGKAICGAFARSGAELLISDIDETLAESCAAEIFITNREAVPVIPVKTDITKKNEVKEFYEKAVSKFGKVDILVNNAGIVGKRAFVFQSDDDIWRRTLEVNLFGTYNCLKAFLPGMIEQRQGRIINIASVSGKQASPSNSAYAASKHGVIGLTRTVASEVSLLGLHGITVNAICPGVTDTEMLTGKGMILDEISRLTGDDRESILKERIQTMNYQKRVMEPDEIADMALYLASDSGRGITGQAINVCGGTVFC